MPTTITCPMHVGIMTDGAFPITVPCKEVIEIYGGTGGEIEEWQILTPGQSVPTYVRPPKIMVIDLTDIDYSPFKVSMREVSSADV